MRCLACHHTNDDRAKFCDQCGQPFATRCATCDSPNRLGARFCSACGQGLTLPLGLPLRALQGPPPHLATLCSAITLSS